MGEPKFKRGDIVNVVCSCTGDTCKNGPFVAIIVKVVVEEKMATIVIPPDVRPMAGYSLGLFTKIGHIDETDIPAPLPGS